MIFFSAIAGCKNEAKQNPTRKDIIETVYASGKILADSEYTVYALNPGIITGKLVREGDQVDRGATIYQVRHSGPAASSAAADFSYQYAKENLSPGSRVLSDLKIAMRNAGLQCFNDSVIYIRYRNLWAQQIGTRVNLDNVETQYQIAVNNRKAAREKYLSVVNDLRVAMKNAQSQSVNARAELGNYTIRAENAGVVYQMLKEKGEAVKTNEAVALMGKPGNRIIRLDVDQQDVDRLQKDQVILIKTDMSGDQIFKGSVVRVYPVMNEADQTFRVDAVFTGNFPPSFIHCSAEANIVIREKRDCLVIPAAFLLTGDSVITRSNGGKKTIAVKTGIRTLDEVEILSGLNLHSELIIPEHP